MRPGLSIGAAPGIDTGTWVDGDSTEGAATGDAKEEVASGAGADAGDEEEEEEEVVVVVVGEEGVLAETEAAPGLTLIGLLATLSHISINLALVRRISIDVNMRPRPPSSATICTQSHGMANMKTRHAHVARQSILTWPRGGQTFKQIDRRTST